MQIIINGKLTIKYQYGHFTSVLLVRYAPVQQYQSGHFNINF
jgi:hypothetical protein